MHLSLEEVLMRLLVAVACGALVGLEREYRRKAAGIKTVMFIAVGAATFTIASVQFTGDPGRVAAQVVTGIGFLGAGAIIHSRRAVQGLTTAALIFVTAALGVAAGAGLFELAGATAAIVLIVLLFVRAIEHSVGQRGDPCAFSFVVPEPAPFLDALNKVLGERRTEPDDLTIECVSATAYRVSFSVITDTKAEPEILRAVLALGENPVVASAVLPPPPPPPSPSTPPSSAGPRLT